MNYGNIIGVILVSFLLTPALWFSINSFHLVSDGQVYETESGEYVTTKKDSYEGNQTEPITTQATDSQTSNWETYSNTEFGFSISFPKYFEEQKNEPGTFCGTLNSIRDCLAVRPIESGSFYDLTRFDPQSQDFIIAGYKEVVVNGYDAVWGNVCDGMCQTSTFVFKGTGGPVAVSFFQLGDFLLRNNKSGTESISSLGQDILKTLELQ